MEVDEIQSLSNKFPRRSGNSNGKINSNKTSFCDEEVADGEIRRQRNNEDGVRGRVVSARGGGVGGGATLDFTAGVGGVGRLCGWPSSRIVRVSRASGGKDRHSKVLTSKGPRDRRVRLSVNTAIQFYDLQDRLGYDQPSKAVEWLIKAAADSITELPPITTTFPDTPQHLSDEKMSSGEGKKLGLDSADVQMEGGGGDTNNNTFHTQQGTLSKSACSSTSETSKGSGGGLSLSRSESRLKARERARERASKDKEKESETTFVAHHHQNVSSVPQNTTFTELLTSGFTGTNINVVNHQHSNSSSPNASGGGVHESNFFQKSPRNWDYFGGTGLLVPSTTTRSSPHVFPGQIQLGSSMQQALATHHVSSPFFTVSGDTNQELHSFSLIPDHFVPIVTTSTMGGNNNNEYNLNFSISNRGTLQSNSSSLLPQIQRFSSADNGSSQSPFFLGTAPNPNAAGENHHQHHHFLPTGFDAGLQLFYGDGSRHADQKGKGKR